MSYLNAEQRQKLLDELKTMKFNKAKSRLRGLDPNSHLVYLRNAQGVGRWMTRYDLPGLGTRVTLVEINAVTDKDGKHRSEFDMSEVIVEPLPDNAN